MITLTFPDGAQRQFFDTITGADLAKSISPSLLKRTVAMVLDGVVCDLADSITRDAKIEFIARTDPRALAMIRHDCAHVMAEAVQALYPGTQVTIGPVIDNGFFYDFARNAPFTPDDFAAIEDKMRALIAQNKPFKKDIWPREKAKEIFKAKGEPYKAELLDAIPEGEPITIYAQGDWFDLCRGPHMVSTGQVGTAFKLLKVAGAYWRGDAKNAMLTRIYATAFASDEDLQAYLTQVEEAEKRDHRRLGQDMDQEVNAPQVLDKSLWETSGHWNWFRENMFMAQVAGEKADDDRVFAIKPMNCPGHVQIFKHGLKSYRDLPLKLSEFGIVHRYEPSGALHGLMRVRAFTQDDAHVFCTEDQLADECLKINDLILSTYADFGFENIVVKLSTRPENRVGDDALWDHAEEVMQRVLRQIEAQAGGRVKTGINPGEGAFYGPKFEYVLRDAIGRDWQCGTTQVDFNLPERFGAFYIAPDGSKKIPVMIHRAICGSMERFTGILLESSAGHLPLWLAPQQAVVCTITADANAYAAEVLARCRALGLRAEADLRNEKISYKIREHSLAKTPVLLVVGKREAEQGGVNLRRLGSQEQTEMTLDAALNLLESEARAPDLRKEIAA